MNILSVSGGPSPSVAAALDLFERQFQYPLGTHDTFRISHGKDYARFFRAMGRGVSFVVEQEGCILGTIGISLRKLSTADGVIHPIAYVGDLKVLPAARGSRVMLSLARAAMSFAVNNRIGSGYSVVMDGTLVTPSSYTGRVGMPAFESVGKIVVLRIPTASVSHEAVAERDSLASADKLQRHFRELSRGLLAPAGGRPSLRAQYKPLPLVLPDGLACGLLEDTLRAKRLIASGGAELLSAHLSQFAFSSSRPDSAIELITVALKLSGQRGFDALFLALDAEAVCQLRSQLQSLNAVEAPATIYGSCLPGGSSSEGRKWLINTAEI